MKIHYQQLTFFSAVHLLSQLPPDNGFEVAFVGRSNSGKSSAINTIARQKGLAKTSRTPGRTRQLIFFGLDESRFIVDLPGYGYAKVAKSERKKWDKLLGDYLRTRQSLKGIVVIMDSRRPLTDHDYGMLQWCEQYQLPAHVVLTKSDKLSRNVAKSTLLAVENEVQSLNLDVTVQLFSSLKREGVEACCLKLDDWLIPD